MDELLMEMAIQTSTNAIRNSIQPFSSTINTEEGNLNYRHFNSQLGRSLSSRNFVSNFKRKSSKVIPHSKQIVALTEGNTIYWG